MSAAGLDMSLDEIIAKKKPSRGTRSGGPTRGGGISKRSSGPIRNTRSSLARSRPYAATSTATNISASPEGKILVSNLAYKVSEADLWELFQTMIGPVRQVNLNFDQSGRSKGTASVVFARKNDAVRSVEKLRNITLDGRELKIEFVVAPNAGPITQRIGGINETRSPARGSSSTRGSTRGTRGGRGGRRPDNRPKKTQEELDAEMSEYMQIDEDSSQAADSTTAPLAQ
ncbi:RNA-binding domain-containing protein [Gigaspora margarita]|uniref:RNA-binding domain-containing protein n=1 Tax=Gigaspora margarita TaxID=4874 RepID=A0A8H4APQ5_GIGMA|nr:RNA-binding domain-containing protein [Gigaspora margarita]